MMTIRANRTIAGAEIERRIDRAKELLESMPYGGVNAGEELESTRAGLLSLSSDVESQLRTMFENGDDLIAEWQALEIGLADDDESRPHNMRRLASSTERGIAWLTGLQNRLDEIPQSPKTPVATWGR
jgi:hypothetical protein